MDYQDLLSRAMSQKPDDLKSDTRFEIPKVRGHLQGNRTVISNFSQIVSVLGKDHDHILKYILKALATPGEYINGLLILGSKVGASRINDKIVEYTKKYVICKTCNKPDTKITKKDGINFLKCTACGASYPVA
ncbi:translation initiation factor IF-2 subunit beta [Candidatus Woesearchaeota archaeon]|nr:translation initiation factor IF-2 subunit beta [Candidatus Woesearchaeota archaeon]